MQTSRQKAFKSWGFVRSSRPKKISDPASAVFLISVIFIIAAHIMMGLTNMMILPSAFAMVAIAIIQFTSSAGYTQYGF